MVIMIYILIILFIYFFGCLIEFSNPSIFNNYTYLQLVKKNYLVLIWFFGIPIFFVLIEILLRME